MEITEAKQLVCEWLGVSTTAGFDNGPLVHMSVIKINSQVNENEDFALFFDDSIETLRFANGALMVDLLRPVTCVCEIAEYIKMTQDALGSLT